MKHLAKRSWTNRASACLGALLISSLAAVAGGAEAAPAGSGGSPKAGVHAGSRFITASPPRTMSYRTARERWTPERIAGAEPLELQGDGTVGSGLDPASSRPGILAAAVPFASSIIRDAAAYPNRVHGRIVGTFPGLGDFSCSGSVTTSGSGSLVTTAGHCVYDPATRSAAFDIVFVPGYDQGDRPYGVWPVSNVITTAQWARRASLDFDLAMMRVVPSPSGPIESVVGSRGIAFDQPLRQRLNAYGYPFNGAPGYNGERLVKCSSGSLPDELNHGGPKSIGLRCDMQEGASGGGFVVQNRLLVSVVSHGHTSRTGKLVNGRIYGPRFGSVAKAMYRAKRPGWPSIGPSGCLGKVATVIGTRGDDELDGTRGRDVIATLGGDDRIDGGGGRDVICGGDGNDRINGKGGGDRIDGGEGSDRCNGGAGSDGLRGCEVRQKS